MRRIAGIELDGARAAVAALVDGVPRGLPDSSGERATPAIVAWREGADGDGPDALDVLDVLVGEAARREALLAPQRAAGRLLERLDSAGNEPAGKECAGKESAGKAGAASAGEGTAAGAELADLTDPLALMGHLLAELARRAERTLGGEVQGWGLAVPASLGQRGRHGLLGAFAVASLAPPRLIARTTALALSRLAQQGEPETLLVVDVGATGVETAVVDLAHGLAEVRGRDAGRGEPGIEAVDVALVERFSPERAAELLADEQARARLLAEVETARELLSEGVSATIDVRALPGGDVSGPLAPADLEGAAAFLVDAVVASVQRSFTLADCSAADVDVVLVGGSGAALPTVRRRLAELLDASPERASTERVAPERVVRAADGAAARGAALVAGEGPLVLEVVDRDVVVGDERAPWIPVVPAGATAPCRREIELGTREDGQETLEIAVARGPAFEESGAVEPFARIAVRGLERAPAGVGRARLRVDLDADGIVRLAAHDVTRGTSGGRGARGARGVQGAGGRELEIAAERWPAPDPERIAFLRRRLAERGEAAARRRIAVEVRERLGHVARSVDARVTELEQIVPDAERAHARRVVENALVALARGESLEREQELLNELEEIAAALDVVRRQIELRAEARGS